MSQFSPEHIHPVLVNFTAALVPASLLSDVAGRALKKKSLHDAAWWMIAYAALITPFTAAAGLMWRRTLGEALPAEVIRRHQALGVALVILLVILAIWRWLVKQREAVPNAAYIIYAAMVVAALVYQGILGGEMVFGP